MRNQSVAHLYAQKQDNLLWTNKVEQVNDNWVWCPMCDDIHVNDTQCQRND